MRVRFAEAADREKLRRFDRRMREGGRSESMPGGYDPCDGGPEPPIFRRLLLAEEGDEVRAGMLLLHHRIFLNGEPLSFCFVQMPLSEGLVNRAYSLAIVKVAKEALAYQPFLISLGVGSLKEPWARFVISQRWRYAAVPFVFFPIHLTRVLRRLRYLERKRGMARIARVAASVGAAVPVGFSWNLYRRWRSPDAPVDVVSGFGDWADELFVRALPDYPAVARRDSSALNLLYPAGEERYVRLRVGDAGWVVVSLVSMNDHRYFGDLTVGVVVDGYGPLGSLPALIGAACDYLAANGADLLVANWSHAAWVAASRKLGFVQGPSNYYVFTSPTAPALDFSSTHLTRGDSDGMVNLRPAAG